MQTLPPHCGGEEPAGALDKWRRCLEAQTYTEVERSVLEATFITLVLVDIRQTDIRTQANV